MQDTRPHYRGPGLDRAPRRAARQGALRLRPAAFHGREAGTLEGYASFISMQLKDPEHRGRGVGRLLLEATLAFSMSRGMPRVVLVTAARNEAAQRLFASMGFRRTMIEMTRELDDPASRLSGPVQLRQIELAVNVRVFG